MLNCQALNNLCLCLSCNIFVLQSKLTQFSAILKQQQNDNTSPLVSRQKRPGTRAITNSGQLQNNCPLFVWQNEGNFMQNVIYPENCSALFNSNKMPYRAFCRQNHPLILNIPVLQGLLRVDSKAARNV